MTTDVATSIRAMNNVVLMRFVNYNESICTQKTVV